MIAKPITVINVLNKIIQIFKGICKWVPRIISIGAALLVLSDISRIITDRYFLIDKNQITIFVLFIIPSIGLVVGWRKEAIGGIIAIIGFIIYGFYFYSLPIEGYVRAEGIAILYIFLFPLFCIPGILYVISSVLSKIESKSK